MRVLTIQFAIPEKEFDKALVHGKGETLHDVFLVDRSLVELGLSVGGKIITPFWIRVESGSASKQNVEMSRKKMKGHIEK